MADGETMTPQVTPPQTPKPPTEDYLDNIEAGFSEVHGLEAYKIVLPLIQEIRRLQAGPMQAREKIFRESLKYVFEKAKLARMHLYNGKGDSYDYLVRIREEEQRLKQADAEILPDKTPEKTQATGNHLP